MKLSVNGVWAVKDAYISNCALGKTTWPNNMVKLRCAANWNTSGCSFTKIVDWYCQSSSSSLLIFFIAVKLIQSFLRRGSVQLAMWFDEIWIFNLTLALPTFPETDSRVDTSVPRLVLKNVELNRRTWCNLKSRRRANLTTFTCSHYNRIYTTNRHHAEVSYI